MNELVLYDAGGTPSPRRVKICLLEKGLPFKIKWLNLALMDQKAPAYLKLNPMGLVPTLVHDGRAIFESNAINEYVEAQFPDPPLVPSDPYGQAQMRMWFAFENDFGKPFRDAAYETFAKDRLKSSESRKTNCAKRSASGLQTKPMFALLPRCSRSIATMNLSPIVSRFCWRRWRKWKTDWLTVALGCAARSSPWPISPWHRASTCSRSLACPTLSTLPADRPVHGSRQGTPELGGVSHSSRAREI